MMCTGLSPEQVTFQNGIMAKATGYNILRPEVVESIFMMHRITNDSIYRDMGWNIFQAFETYSKVQPPTTLLCRGSPPCLIHPLPAQLSCFFPWQPITGLFCCSCMQNDRVMNI